jgi:hypothetical protein
MAETANMASFTCLACRVGFASSEAQRVHYKTDWHRYNLKRKIAGMVPVSAANFQERVTAQQDKDKEAKRVQVASACLFLVILIFVFYIIVFCSPPSGYDGSLHDRMRRMRVEPAKRFNSPTHSLPCLCLLPRACPPRRRAGQFQRAVM